MKYTSEIIFPKRMSVFFTGLYLCFSEVYLQLFFDLPWLYSMEHGLMY